MLGPIRKFSSTIYAKVLLIIIIIPFIFWGMGGITSGNKNIIVMIDKDKYTTQEFADFIKRSATEKVKSNDVENFLSTFIGEKLIEKEVEHFGIKLSDSSLAKLLKIQKDFKRDNKFSRTEYEKFLLKNNITAITFESILSQQENKKQLLDFIGGGLSTPNFLVNLSYDRINQKRDIELIDLNDLFKKEFNFTQDQIKTYYENNKDKFSEIYKSIKFLELNTKNLVDNDEFSDLFFKKIDEIDDLIISGVNFDTVTQKFNLNDYSSLVINNEGKDFNSKNIKDISKNLIEKIFNIDDVEPTALIELENRYYIVEISKTEKILKNFTDKSINEKILFELSNKTKRKLTAEIIDKINKNTFKKINFDNLAKKENIEIKKIKLKSQNDDEVLKKGILRQVYSFPEKRIIVVNEIGLSENYLIYIDKIENVTIDKNSDEYERYAYLTRIKIMNDLYNTYDSYIRKRYKIDINYQALNTVKNYFN